jgi:hypothetical protein
MALSMNGIVGFLSGGVTVITPLEDVDPKNASANRSRLNIP